MYEYKRIREQGASRAVQDKEVVRNIKRTDREIIKENRKKVL